MRGDGTVDLAVVGMTCRACEVRVGKALRGVPGVRHVDVSSARGRARVRTDADVPAERWATAVRRAGYELGVQRRPWLTRDGRVWRDVALAVGAVAVVAVAAGLLGVQEASAGWGASAMGGSLVLVVLLGLAAGVSTCMALVGGLVLAVSARHAQVRAAATTAGSGRGATTWHRLRPHVAFNAGRVVGFGVLGAALGAVGSAVRLSGGAVALVTVVVSLAMIAVGVQLTAVSPRLAGRIVALPEGLSRRLRLDERADGGYRDSRTAALGAATFLLPCGFTQAVQLYAISTGSPVRAGVVMALFALGTVPGLLAIGGLTALVPSRRPTTAPRFLRFAGVAVVAFAVVNLSGAATVLAPGLFGGLGPAAVSGTAAVSENVTLEGGVQVMRTTQVVDGYEPQLATVVAGTPVRWEIDSVAASCASALYAPDLGGGSAPVLLPPGVTTLEFTPERPGRLYYSCAMGMYTGAVDVIAP
ncbi:sulfite exporter TauE/SafE family protein [Actinotalea sp. Marseille-Q4924]|uniref:urease accessory protein UreH domain-containing protein n=1 Tax=Actinotalea sp. Marseille-Q4924 TaxID=2866571 RepID=UPI001CE4AB01|nr:sulfite exporter TauE/SafE family protein [Actinotalea sp. Marseille-Q4924]